MKPDGMGLLLRRRAEEIIELMDITMKELVVQDEMAEGEIKIGCGELASVCILSELIRTFNQKYPQEHYQRKRRGAFARKPDEITLLERIQMAMEKEMQSITLAELGSDLSKYIAVEEKE